MLADVRVDCVTVEVEGVLLVDCVGLVAFLSVTVAGWVGDEFTVVGLECSVIEEDDIGCVSVVDGSAVSSVVAQQNSRPAIQDKRC